MLFLTLISTVIILFLLITSTSISFISGYIRPNRCYSCMSPLYEEFFKDGSMSRYFYEPRNFTSQCNDPMQPSNIGLVPCKSICLTLTQDFIVMGKYDLCRDVKASDLFRYESDSQTVRVCSCLGDRCNVSASYYEATCQLVVAAIIFVFFIPKLF